MVVDKAEKADKVEKASAKRDSATVVYAGGERTYTREEHGDDFEKLAKEFATKREGTVA